MRFTSLFAVLLGASAAHADDAALLIGNERYTGLDRVVGGAAIATADSGLGRVGFDVTQVANGTGIAAQQAAVDFAMQAQSAERVIAALSGSFATDGTRTWFMPVDATAPHLFALDGAISVDSMMQVMAGAQGQAILALGVESAEDDVLGVALREGLGALDIPQGVTVVQGSPRAIVDFVSAMAAPGADVMALVAGNRRLTAEGFVPAQLVMVDADAAPAVVATETGATPEIDLAAEQALWDGARALDTVDAYENYLARFPEGANAERAVALIDEIQTEPNRPARLAEDALGLSRDARRDVQRDLTLLDFDPRGIDGIFGPGTRNAVKNWQQQNGFSQTTYLTAAQINQLDAQAARRAAELEAEAERERARQLRLDRAYWAETGALGDEPGLRAYLDRFPDGTFAAQARAGLQEIEDAKQAAAAAEDNAAWEQAVTANTAAAYQAYLQAFPGGALVAEAQARIAALTAPAEENADAALAEERALGLNAITLRLIEARLQQINLSPGQVDGTFDATTRGAIRNFQRDRGLGVSGFLNEETVVRLLADGLSTLGNQ